MPDMREEGTLGLSQTDGLCPSTKEERTAAEAHKSAEKASRHDKVISFPKPIAVPISIILTVLLVGSCIWAAATYMAAEESCLDEYVDRVTVISIIMGICIFGRACGLYAPFMDPDPGHETDSTRVSGEAVSTDLLLTQKSAARNGCSKPRAMLQRLDRSWLSKTAFDSRQLTLYALAFSLCSTSDGAMASNALRATFALMLVYSVLLFVHIVFGKKYSE